MEKKYVLYTTALFEKIRETMISLKQSAIIPMVILNPGEDNEVLCVLEWKTKEEEEILFQNIVGVVRETNVQTVILFGTAEAMVPKMDHEFNTYSILFGSIYRPGERTYSVAQVMMKVEGETVFGEMLDSSKDHLITFQMPPLWKESENL